MALAVLAMGAFDRILAFIIFSAVVFLALTVVTLFRTSVPVKRWWFPAAPVLFLAGIGVLAAMLLMHSPGPSLLGAAIVLVGLPVRALLLRWSRGAAKARIEPESAETSADVPDSSY